MTDIPADIAKTAKTAFHQSRLVGDFMPIALALVSEREGCARMADDNRFPDNPEPDLIRTGWNEASSSIASAILSPERAK